MVALGTEEVPVAVGRVEGAAMDNLDCSFSSAAAHEEELQIQEELVVLEALGVGLYTWLIHAFVVKVKFG